MYTLVSRRQVLKGALALGPAAMIAPAISACGPAEQRAEGETKEIVVGYDGGTWEEYTTEIMSGPFADETGAQIRYLTTTETARIARLAAAGTDRVMDCAKFGTPVIDQALALEALAELDPELVPSLDDIHPAFKNEYWAANTISTWGITYRTDKIPDGISSWWDLWDARLKGHVALPAFDWLGDTFLLIVNHLEGGDPADPVAGADRLKEYMANQPSQMASTDQGRQLFTSGEVWAAPFWDGTTRALQREGLPLEFVFPTEGAAGLGYGLAAMTNAGNLDLTQRYIDFTLQPEQQAAFAVKTDYSPTNLKVLNDPPSEVAEIAIRPETLDQMLVLDHQTASKNVQRYSELWNTRVLAG